jgi:snurportin-1
MTSLMPNTNGSSATATTTSLAQNHRDLYKKGMRRMTFEERIQNAKLRQRKIRQKLLAKARSLVTNKKPSVLMDVDKYNEDELNNDNNNIAKHSSRSVFGDDNRGVEKRMNFAEQLIEPEWMIRLPNDIFLSDNITSTSVFDDTENEAGWYVIPRIEGRRCLVISNNGKTVSRDKNGITIHRFHSILPNGGNSSRGNNKMTSSGIHGAKSGNFSIFDCIYNDKLQAYFVLDVMCWKGQSFYGCTASFRFYWAQSKLKELGIEEFKTVGNNIDDNNNNNDDSTSSPFSIYFLPHYHSSKQVVQEIVVSSNSFNIEHGNSSFLDGLIFIAKSSFYEPGVLPSPLWLIWKNTICSRYFRPASEVIISNDNGKTGKCLVLDNVVLKSNENCAFMLTREGVPILSRDNILFGTDTNTLIHQKKTNTRRRKNSTITNWSMLKPNTLYKFQLSLNCNINHNDSNNASFLKQLMVLSYNSEIDEIKYNEMSKLNDMHTMHNYFKSTFTGKASKRRIYPDSYTKICFYMFPSNVTC